MTLTQLINRFRVQVPDAKTSVISNTDLTTILNEAPDKINLIAKIYKGSVTFNMTANDQDYALSEVVPRFLGPARVPARFMNSDGNYKDMIPKSREWIERKIENWLEASAGDPQYYWLDGDEFWCHPKPSATRTSGFKLYGLLTAVPMTNGSNYPWTNTTSEIKAFRPMDLAIVAYARWQITPALAKAAIGVLDYQGFLTEIKIGVNQVRRRPDVMANDSLMMNVSS